MDRRLAKAGWWLLSGLIFGSAASTGVMLTKEAEHDFAPVVSRAVVLRSEVDGDGLLIWGQFTKHRDCKFVEAVAQVGPIALDLEFRDLKPNQAQNRAVGLQDFGPWRVSPGIYPIKITLRHACHPLWYTTTTLLEGYRP